MLAHTDASCHTECASLSPVIYARQLALQRRSPGCRRSRLLGWCVCLSLTHILLLLCRHPEHPERCLEQAFAQKTQEPEATQISVSFNHTYHSP